MNTATKKEDVYVNTINIIGYAILITVIGMAIMYFSSKIQFNHFYTAKEKIKAAEVEYKIWEPNSTMLEGWFMDWDTGNLPYEASGSKIVRESCTAWKFHKFDVQWNIAKYCKKIHIER